MGLLFVGLLSVLLLLVSVRVRCVLRVVTCLSLHVGCCAVFVVVRCSLLWFGAHCFVLFVVRRCSVWLVRCLLCIVARSVLSVVCYVSLFVA